MSDFHDASAAYLESMRQEMPLYDRLQDELVKATYGVAVKRILDLGCGTGETSRRCLAAYPDADLTGIDPSEPLLQIARAVLGDAARLRLGFLDEPLPKGPFDLVVSALSVGEVAARDHGRLFDRVRRALAPRGRFVVADLVSLQPTGAAAAPGIRTAPVRLDVLEARLREAGFTPEVTWAQDDLAVVRASV